MTQFERASPPGRPRRTAQPMPHERRLAARTRTAIGAMAAALTLSCGSPEDSATPSEATLGASPATITTRLTGFLPAHAQRSPDGTLPIRWHESRSSLLADGSRCLASWHELDLMDGSDEPGVPMHSDAEPNAPRFVRTCAEWHQACTEGFYARTTLDMDREGRIALAAGMLAARAHARPSAMSGFLDFDLAAASRHLLPPTTVDFDLPDGTGEPERWTLEGNVLRHEDEMFGRSVEPVLFADLDGDGWEDMLLISGDWARHGTMRGCGLRAISRVEGGPLIDISCRLPKTVSDDRRAPTARSWQPHHLIAPNAEIALVGTCECANSPHALAVGLSIDARGFLDGSLRCDRMAHALPLKGALSESRGSIEALATDGVPTLEFHFDWKCAAGNLSLTGFRVPVGGMESSDFAVAGRAPSADERMRSEGWISEIAFEAGGSRLLLRRGCARTGFVANTDALCLESNGFVRELVRFDRIEWAASGRHPEDDPASDEEMRRGLAASVLPVGDGTEFLLLDCWNYGASTCNPSVVAVPIRGERLMVSELRVFSQATVDRREETARILVHDLRAGADPYRDDPQREPVAWTWAGAAWSED